MSIRTLIVDDATLYRKVFSEAISAFPEIEPSGTAANGSIALKKLAVAAVDLVFLDVNMPEMSGLEVLRKIRSAFPLINVVMISSPDNENADDTIKALELGAIDFIKKPSEGDYSRNLSLLQDQIRNVLRLVQLRISTRILSKISSARPAVSECTAARDSTTIRPKMVPDRISLCVIGVSTGGPEALGRVIPLLDQNLAIPVLIVQHMPPLFTKSLAESLARRSKIHVGEAIDGEPVLPGRVYIAPGGRHMAVAMQESHLLISLNNDAPENSCRPSVDVLFRSVANTYKDHGILAVIMTGMGNDGLAGVQALKNGTCCCLTQSESSCVVYGMPRAIDEAHLSNESLPLDMIAPAINRIASERKYRSAFSTMKDDK